jgi:hypothetical protein
VVLRCCEAWSPRWDGVVSVGGPSLHRCPSRGGRSAACATPSATSWSPR